MTFISGYQDRRFWRISFCSSWGYLYFLLLCVLLKGEGRGRFFVIEGRGGIPIRYLVCRYSHHLPKEGKCFLGRRGEGGEDDLDLGGLRVGGPNHLPGVSGHWCDSGSSSSSSGDPLGISRITGGNSSRRMRELKSAAGGSSPTSNTRLGRAECGGDCG